MGKDEGFYTYGRFYAQNLKLHMNFLKKQKLPFIFSIIEIIVLKS